MKLEERIKIIERKKIFDSRGWFLKVINGKEEFLPQFTSEVYIISVDPGECRANHYHIEAHEWFTLITGVAHMVIEDIYSKQRIIIELYSENPKTIYVPNNIAHSFQNIGAEPFILVTYTNKLYNSMDTIPYTF